VANICTVVVAEAHTPETVTLRKALPCLGLHHRSNFCFKERHLEKKKMLERRSNKSTRESCKEMQTCSSNEQKTEEKSRNNFARIHYTKMERLEV
jgi:hypothetical protein